MSAETPWSDPDHDIMADIMEVRRKPLTTGPAQTVIGTDFGDKMQAAVELILNAKRNAVERWGETPMEIRVGTRAGLDYFRRAAGTMPQRPDLPPWDVHDGDSICGLRIVVDRRIQPDMIRIGSLVYVVGTGNNGVAEGTMVRIDTRGLPGSPDFTILPS